MAKKTQPHKEDKMTDVKQSPEKTPVNPSTPLGSKTADKITDEVKDKEKDFFYEEKTKKNKDGEEVKELMFALTEEDAKAADEIAAQTPNFENQTQSLLGTPGMTNLTNDGELNGDRSEKAFGGDTGLDDFVEEVELTAGPNPMPNREGNEKLKQELIGVGAMPSPAIPTPKKDDKSKDRSKAPTTTTKKW